MSSDSATRALSLPALPGEPMEIAAAAGAIKNGATASEKVANEAATTDINEASKSDASSVNEASIVNEASNELATSASETTRSVVPDHSASDLPPEVVAPENLRFLIRAVPQAALWKWLGEDERLWLQQRMTRGFQNTIRALRQPAVQTRLVDHLKREAGDFKAVLHLWAESEPPPRALSAIRALPDDLDWADDDQARSAFATLRDFDSKEISLALAATERRAILDAWLSNLAAAPDRNWNDDENANVAPHEYSSERNADVSIQAPKSIHDARSALEARAASSARDEVKRNDGASEAEAKQAAERKRLGEETARWRQQAAQARAEATAARAALETRESQARRESQQWQLKLAQETRRGAQAEAQLAETQKTLDRTARRLKQIEKADEDSAAEIKRLKRQVRQNQQLHEELKKQLASVESKLQESQARLQEAGRLAAQPQRAPRSAATRKTYSSPSISTAPLVAGANSNSIYSDTTRRGDALANTPALLDQPFLWKGENRAFRVSAREVRRAIDRNDETFVFALIQGLDALREADARLHRVFLDRVRQAGRYYGRVLTADTTRVLVDASNVARFEKNARGKGELSHLLAMRDELRRRDCFPLVMVADASLRHHIDEPEELLALSRRGELEIAPIGTEADEYLAREARRSGAYVVTNDRTFHLKVAPDWEPPRINFRIHDGYVLLDEF